MRSVPKVLQAESFIYPLIYVLLTLITAVNPDWENVNTQLTDHIAEALVILFAAPSIFDALNTLLNANRDLVVDALEEGLDSLHFSGKINGVQVNIDMIPDEMQDDLANSFVEHLQTLVGAASGSSK